MIVSYSVDYFTYFALRNVITFRFDSQRRYKCVRHILCFGQRIDMSAKIRV